MTSQGNDLMITSPKEPIILQAETSAVNTTILSSKATTKSKKTPAYKDNIAASTDNLLMFFANCSTFHFMHHSAMQLQLSLQDIDTEAQNSVKS